MINPDAPVHSIAQWQIPSQDEIEIPDMMTGLTIRAEFAKAAMQGMISKHGSQLMYDECAAHAISFADALIAELNKKESV